ncbi:hypothetical protein JOE68_004485 [Saccharothrix algeriensis]|uniref:Uncharacterized protein n=1 Tax=Saccharothrix algeriensis TaxID=173560 RepID=A0ABS2SBI2_9PSEU|nr:hypothetical protein [Saccharothrix algeriensis]
MRSVSGLASSWREGEHDVRELASGLGGLDGPDGLADTGEVLG